jgi:hypothetical protein
MNNKLHSQVSEKNIHKMNFFDQFFFLTSKDND